MYKVCRLTGNKNLAKNGFSSANAAIEWGNKAKDVITTAVTTATQQKENEHALALTEMRNAKERDLKKNSMRLPPSARELTD